jgi:hypothetical protein
MAKIIEILQTVPEQIESKLSDKKEIKTERKRPPKLSVNTDLKEFKPS